MKNILTTPCPDYVEIEGKQYKVHTDFRRWIEADIVLHSDALPHEKAAALLKLCYVQLPPTFSKSMAAAMRFYAGDAAAERSAKKSTRLFDFHQDAPEIYAAFYQQYGINLQTENLHWWQFLALFSSLGEACKLAQIMHYRGMDLSSVHDEKTRQFYARMKRRYALKTAWSKAQSEADMLQNLGRLFF